MRPTLSLSALFLTASLLASCATPSSPLPSIEPQRPSPANCVTPRDEPVLPDTAGLERPLDQANADATAAFLNWVSDVLVWGRELAQGQEKAASSPECQR